MSGAAKLFILLVLPVSGSRSDHGWRRRHRGRTDAAVDGTDAAVDVVVARGLAVLARPVSGCPQAQPDGHNENGGDPRQGEPIGTFHTSRSSILTPTKTSTAARPVLR